MRDISILLPSLRPEAVKTTIEEFELTSMDIDYEIIVVSPFEVKGTRVVWVKEEEPQGSVLATSVAYNIATGRYVIYFSDDVSPTQNCLLEMYRFMLQHESPFIGAFMMMSNRNEIGPFAAYQKLYACYGCLSKETASLLGGMFDPRFLYSWADIDLSLRCWEKGGRVEICPTAIVHPRQINDDIYKNHRKQYWDRDVNQFFELWHEKLGKDLPRVDGVVNRRFIKRNYEN